jgi:hypothetical protein
MNLRAAILLASLGANVLLATVVVRQQRTVGSGTETTPPDAGTNHPAASRKAKKSNDVNPPLGGNESATVVAAFQWGQLESPEYPEYIAKLRAFGVPEKTIRDLIIADVQKLYRPKLAALRPPKEAAKTNFWENRFGGYNPNSKLTKDQRAQITALQKEQTELIKTLLGKNVYQEMTKESGYPDYMERQFGSLSPDIRDKVSDMQQRFQEARSAIYAKANGYIDQDTQAELKAVQKKFRDELAGVLTPEQVKDYELRSSETANQMRWQLSSFEPNEKEFRAIFEYKQTLEDLNPPRNADDDTPRPTPEEIKARQQKQKDLDAAIAQALAPDRLKEFMLGQSWEYQNLLEAGVAKESVFKVADIKDQVETAANKVRQDQTLTPEQRNAALQAIRAETEKTLAETLGERRAKAYGNNGGYWLRNLAPRENQP